MIRRGDILYDPISRETITFIQTSGDTAGKLLQMEVSMAPGKNQFYTGLHIHPKQQETLIIKSGQVMVTIEGEKKLYKQGDSIIIPPGASHKFANISKQEELNFICEITPALHTETLIETTLALSRIGKLNINNSIPLLQAAATLNKYKNHVYLTALPLWVQKFMLRLVSPFALLLGYKSELNYKKVISEKRPVFF